MGIVLAFDLCIYGVTKTRNDSLFHAPLFPPRRSLGAWFRLDDNLASISVAE
jgi:hypothetical protein